ncbi:CobD/CbiB family cobalamin biosynthesis protein [Halobaculum sp. WSA2]|uniref:Probable cobalamin biosynthesis protein CobD n=1 Tax=Halobaculum saliterrae TaxID=2073113 RepID=A0A6B0SZ91_9EURY|nr:CobD/CbiB family cobalamin biosynthesis protein [Halobaculum saliterrae]MXR41883.1 CobD/CbiB family cobalamin biosynthesis protein [Halobaculum saliterrae]
MGLTALAAVGLAAALDAAIAEPPSRVHPIALFGRVVTTVDREWARPRSVGVAAAVVLPLAFAAVAWGVVAGAGRVVAASVAWTGTAVALVAPVATVATAVVAGLALFSLTSLRMLVAVASEVVEAAERDADAARESAIALVGRDTSSLSAAWIRSAAVESAAENLADGLVAPLLAFALGAQASVAVGVAAAAWVKGVNTLDSMLGYPDKPVGTASARLDDAVMWVPARVSAVLLAVAAGSPRSLVDARRWARVPASPNSGWPMATAAAALGVRLEKSGAYALNPGAALPSLAEARRGVRVVAVAGALAFLLAGAAAAVAGVGS